MAIDPNPTYTTPRDLIMIALQDSGVVGLGESAPMEVINRAFKRFNWLLTFWATKRWFAWRLIDIAAAGQGSTSTGQLYYTVGAGGDFNVNSDFGPDFGSDFGSGQPWGFRPVQIEKAYSRMLASSPAQPVDYPLIPILSREDYSEIRLKFQQNFPTHYFYDPAAPLGLVYFWPQPLPGQFEMHIVVRQPLPTVASLDDHLLLPPEYFLVLELTLARWLRWAVGKLPADQELNSMHRNAVNGLKNNNTQVANLEMPGGLARTGIYNILADEWH